MHLKHIRYGGRFVLLSDRLSSKGHGNVVGVFGIRKSLEQHQIIIYWVF